MNAKYLAMVATVSLLSVGGVVTSCGGSDTPAPAESPAESPAADPCAAKDPCAGADPCAAKDPCAGS